MKRRFHAAQQLRKDGRGQAPPLRQREKRLRISCGALLMGLAICAPWRLQAQGPLFPQSFRVEHHLVQEDGDGSRFVGESVVDTYGGSWIVSQRPDGSRLIVDLARRELTEVREEKGTYWTMSFDRLAELQGRLRRAQGLGAGEPAEPRDGVSAKLSTSAVKAPAELVVSEVTESGAAPKAARTGEGTAVGPAQGPAIREGVKHLRVARRGANAESATLEVWVDPRVRLTTAAMAALDALEGQVLTGQSRTDEEDTPASAPGRYLMAARKHAGGAFAVRTVRPTATPPDAPPLGTVEDIATSLEPLERFPGELAEIPEGLRRVPHPLEATVRFLEEEAQRNAAMGGAGAARP